LVSEAVITRGEHFRAARYRAGAKDEGLNTDNILDVTLAPGVPPPDLSVERSFFTTSSCGLCGKASIDAVRAQSAFDVRDDTLREGVASSAWLDILVGSLGASSALAVALAPVWAPAVTAPTLADRVVAVALMTLS
jgi:hypothetical protein